MRVGGGGGNAAAAAARAAAEAARRAAEAAARKAAAEAARRAAQKAAAEAARKAAAEAAKKTAAQAAQAREAQQQAREATANANQAQAAAKGAKGPEADKLQVKAEEATTKAVEARTTAKKELEQFKQVAAEGQKKAAEAQKLSQAVNDAAVKAGEKPVFNDVKGFDALKDTFEDASTVKSGADFQAKFGADCGTDMQELTRAKQGDFVSDTQLDEIASRVQVTDPGSDDSRVDASKQLKTELENLPPASRARLLEKMRPTLEEISKGANGTPDEDDRKEILRNLADAATMSGPQGAGVVSQSFANVAVNDHTDVDNGDQLGGALKDVIKEDPKRAAFGFTLGNELKGRGDLGEASENVLKGTYEAVTGEDPSKLERIAGEAKDVIEDVGAKVLKGFAETFDFATKPLTDALNGQIDKLGPGDSYKVGLGARAQVTGAVGVGAKGELEVKRAEDGKYTVSMGGEVNVDLVKKLGLPGVSLGVDGKVEFSFANAEEAKRGADTLAQIGGAAVVGSAAPGGALVAGGAATVANLGDGDAQFLMKNVSAIELGGKASADLTGKLKLPNDAAGQPPGVSLEAGQRARIEFAEDGQAPSLTFTQNGKATASAALPGRGPVELQGEVSAAVTVQHKLTLPKDFSLGDLGNVGEVAKGSKFESSVKVDLQQKATASVPVGPFAAGAEGTVTSSVEFKGNPAAILRQGLPKVLDGDFAGATKAVGKNAEVTASVELNLKGTASAEANFGTTPTQATAPGAAPVPPGRNVIGGGNAKVTGDIEARLKLSGNPIELATKGLPKLVQGDLPGAVSAVGDKVKVEAEVKQTKTTNGGIEVGDPLGLFKAEFTTQRVDVGDKPLWSYGVDDKQTKADESRTASQAARDLDRRWDRLTGTV